MEVPPLGVELDDGPCVDVGGFMLDKPRRTKSGDFAALALLLLLVVLVPGCAVTAGG
jgi:hypothetical protein